MCVIIVAGNYVLQYLMTRVGLSPDVIQKLVQLVSKITKHGWFDADKSKGFLFRDISDEVHKFLRVCLFAPELTNYCSCQHGFRPPPQ